MLALDIIDKGLGISEIFLEQVFNSDLVIRIAL